MSARIVTEQALIERARGGDGPAISALVDLHHADLIARIRRVLPSDVGRKVSSEDILQEAYIVAFRRLGEFQARGEGAFRAWLTRIAYNKVREAVRRYRNTAKRGFAREVTRGARPDTNDFAGRGPSPSQVVIGEEARERVARATALLSDDHREILRLVQVEDFGFEEAAVRIGRSPAAAKKLFGRALARLAELLEI